MFILDPHFVQPARLVANRFAFLLECLRDLDLGLRALGSRLFVVRGPPDDVFPTLLSKWKIDKVVWEIDTEGYARERDSKLAAVCAANGVEVKSVLGHTLYNPEELCARAGGELPSSYESFLKLLARLPPPARPYPSPSHLPAAITCDVSDDNHLLPTMEECGYKLSDCTSAFLGSGGERGALARLEARVSSRPNWVRQFSKPSTNPAALEPDTTGLSPYLKFGALGCRSFYWKLEDIPGKSTTPPVNNVYNIYMGWKLY